MKESGNNGVRGLQSRVVLKDGMAFDATVEGFPLQIDASDEHGGHGYGTQPKALVLTALAGCTAMDVISILRKMRVQVDRFEVETQGVQSEEHPKVFKEIEITYSLEGPELPVTKVLRAVALSEEKYCAVNAMLAPTAKMTRVAVLNGVVHSPSAVT